MLDLRWLLELGSVDFATRWEVLCIYCFLEDLSRCSLLERILWVKIAGFPCGSCGHMEGEESFLPAPSQGKC